MERSIHTATQCVASHTRTCVAARLQHVLWPGCSPCINSSCGAHRGTHLRVIILIIITVWMPVWPCVPCRCCCDVCCHRERRGEERQ